MNKYEMKQWGLATHCGECLFFHTDCKDRSIGPCYRHPPMTGWDKDGKPTYIRPIVTKYDYCGDAVPLHEPHQCGNCRHMDHVPGADRKCELCDMHMSNCDICFFGFGGDKEKWEPMTEEQIAMVKAIKKGKWPIDKSDIQGSEIGDKEEKDVCEEGEDEGRE